MRFYLNNNDDNFIAIAAIGASAGGLSAISELLSELSDKNRIAIIVLQHIAPKYESHLPEILRKTTKLKTVEIINAMEVESNTIYILPPAKQVTIKDATLYLSEPDTNSAHSAIDVFFKSLARDQNSRAIGVVLSGSGGDGTRGLCAIKSSNGFTFAQTPESAQFDSMPLSAIASGCVDQVASPKGIAAQINGLAEKLKTKKGKAISKPDLLLRESGPLLDTIFDLIRKKTGNDFSEYKRTTVIRRLQRRMVICHVDSLQDYIELLKGDNDETEELFRDLLINVTRFFRDPDAFDALAKNVFAPLIQTMPADHTIRVWVPACSTGEEVYSIAMTLVETLGKFTSPTKVQIFGTDVDFDVIKKARKGVYTESMLVGVSSKRLQRFFTKTGQRYVVRKSLRELCIFAPQNVLIDPPFSHIDILCCRNLLIYLNRDLQTKLLQIFHYALRPDGILFLGRSETTGPASDFFSLVDSKNKIYRRKQITGPKTSIFATTKSTRPIGDKMPPTEPRTKPIVPGQQPLDLGQIALNQFAPPGIIINDKFDIVYFLGNAGRYLDPVAGNASLNLLKLARRELAGPLRILVDSAIRKREPAHQSNISFGSDKENFTCRIEVAPLPSTTLGDFFSVVFYEQPIEKSPKANKKGSSKKGADRGHPDRIAELENELAETKRYLQVVTEDHEVTHEELQAANEEIQSTNEELQSTNEELETAREELQSANEELATVNEELETRNSELTQSINDLNNLLDSVDIPIIMVDEQLGIRRFTPPAAKLFNLIAPDIGRPLTVIKPNVDLPDLSPLITEVLNTLKPKEIEVHDRENHIYALRLVPYRTEERKITGCVLILVDITEIKKQAARTQYLASAVSDSIFAIVVQDLNGNIQTWNPQANFLYGYTEDEILGKNFDILVPESLRKEMASIKARLMNGEIIVSLKSRRITKSGEIVDIIAFPSLLSVDRSKPYAIVTMERRINPSETSNLISIDG